MVVDSTALSPFHQVEATTEKRPMVTRGNGLFFRDTKCTEITGRPDLTGIGAMIS